MRMHFDFLRLVSFLLLVILMVQCKPKKMIPKVVEVPTPKVINTALPTWAKDAVIYEVNVRQYTQEGTFQSFRTHLPRLEKMGVDVLSFLPLFPISEAKRQGSLGNYDAVRDFRGINSEYGDMAEFEAMVKDIHNRGMKIILDWVPNHTGWDHEWLEQHKNWYVQNGNGDLAALNYDNPAMRKAMIDDMMFWINDKDIDGFRMNKASRVPNDFWEQVKQEVYSAHKPIFMLAGSELVEHRETEAFQMSYGLSFHQLLNDIANRKKSARDVWKWIDQDRRKFSKGFHMHYTSSHDENTSVGTVFDRMGDAHQCLAVLTFVFEGMPFIFGGQEEPLRKRLASVEKDAIEFNKLEYEEFYTNLIQFKKTNNALWNGPYGATMKRFSDHVSIFSFTRQSGKNTVTCFFNLSDQEAYTILPKTVQGTLYDDDEKFGLILEADTELELQPWEYLIISND